MRLLKSVMVVGLVLGLSSTAFAKDKPSGTVTLTFRGISAGVGGSIGKGELVFKGFRLPFEASAFSLGEIGIGKKKGKGFIYNLKSLEDFNGTFTARKTGIAVIAGRGYERLENDKGVVIELKNDETGLQLGLAAGKTKMTLHADKLKQVMAALNAPAKKTAEKAIFFDTGSSKISKAEQTKLHEIVNMVRKNPATEVVVTGYTDTTGGFEKNVELSHERAKMVAKELRAIAKQSGLQQLPPERVNIFGLGQAGGPANTPEQANRRVDIAIYSSPRSLPNVQ